jgi:hypothetical protein
MERSMRAIIAIALCSACGGGATGADAALAIDSSDVDAPPDSTTGPTCAASSFTTSAPVSAFNTAATETFLRLSNDELTAYFSRQEPDEILYVATRASTTGPFSMPTTLTINGNGTLETTSATVTADGLALYFTSNRPGTLGSRDIYRATRAVTTANFGAITQMTALSSASNENDVYVLPDHSAIYFSSNRSGAYRIYRSEMQGNTFGTPDEVFSDTAGVSRVVVSPDELTMLYSIGGDMRLSTRASTTANWLPGVTMPAFDTAETDVPTWISADLCRMYFATDTSGNYQLRVAVRTPQ